MSDLSVLAELHNCGVFTVVKVQRGGAVAYRFENDLTGDDPVYLTEAEFAQLLKDLYALAGAEPVDDEEA